MLKKRLDLLLPVMSKSTLSTYTSPTSETYGTRELTGFTTRHAQYDHHHTEESSVDKTSDIRWNTDGPAEDEDPPPRSATWAYGPLEEENVWDK